MDSQERGNKLESAGFECAKLLAVPAASPPMRYLSVLAKKICGDEPSAIKPICFPSRQAALASRQQSRSLSRERTACVALHVLHDGSSMSRRVLG